MEPLSSSSTSSSAFLTQLSRLESEVANREAEIRAQIAKFLKENEVFVERGIQNSEGDLKARLNSLRKRVTKGAIEDLKLEDLPEGEKMLLSPDLNVLDLDRFSAVSQGSSKQITGDPQRVKEAIYRKFALGKAVWEGLGVKYDETPEQEAKSLPDNIEEILNTPCSAFFEKYVEETHVLVRIPEGLTLNKLQEVAKKLFPNNQSGFYCITPSILAELGDKRQEKSEWVLATKDVIPDSRNETIQKQLSRIKNLAYDSKAPYTPPYALTLIACIFAKYAASGTNRTRLFNNAPLTYTRTLDRVQGSTVIVGAFSRAGLYVCCEKSFSEGSFSEDASAESVGIAALCRL